MERRPWLMWLRREDERRGGITAPRGASPGSDRERDEVILDRPAAGRLLPLDGDRETLVLSDRQRVHDDEDAGTPGQRRPDVVAYGARGEQ